MARRSAIEATTVLGRKPRVSEPTVPSMHASGTRLEKRAQLLVPLALSTRAFATALATLGFATRRTLTTTVLTTLPVTVIVTTVLTTLPVTIPGTTCLLYTTDAADDA